MNAICAWWCCGLTSRRKSLRLPARYVACMVSMPETSHVPWSAYVFYILVSYAKKDEMTKMPFGEQTHMRISGGPNDPHAVVMWPYAKLL